MITLFVPSINEDINLSNVIITRLNMDYTLVDGYLKTHIQTSLCKRVNNKNECYGLYLTYNVSNIETIMNIINEPDDLPIVHTFNYRKVGMYYVVY